MVEDPFPTIASAVRDFDSFRKLLEMDQLNYSFSSILTFIQPLCEHSYEFRLNPFGKLLQMDSVSYLFSSLFTRFIPTITGAVRFLVSIGLAN